VREIRPIPSLSLLGALILVALAPCASIPCLDRLASGGEARASTWREPPVARNQERPRFLFDAGAIWGLGGPALEIVVEIPYPELMFRLEDGAYRAAFDLIVVLRQGKRQIGGDLWHESIAARSQAETRSRSSIYRRRLILPARPGEIDVEVTVSETASGNEGRVRQRIDVRDLKKDEVRIEKIWFERCPTDSASSPRAGPVETIVSRRFGSSAGPVCVRSSARMRGIDPEAGLRASWKVVGARREAILQGDLTPASIGDSVPLSFRLPLETLWLGGYELLIDIEIARKKATRLVAFEMDETMVSLDHNPEESIALIRYIASVEEIALLEDADPAVRGKAWDEFWRKRDPTPGTDVNEFKEEFFHRVRYANENFSSLGPGWRTDRGMIYIQYGPPDQVESFPHNIDGPPYEIWTYYAESKRFVFVDYDGFGRYELHTPGRFR